MSATTSSRATDEPGRVPQRAYPFADPGLAVDPPIISRHPDDVAEVSAEAGYRLQVRFFDGTAGFVDLRELIFGERPGVFAALRDEEEFARVGLGFGTVMWANELDLAPNVMYEEIKRSGVWVLR